MEPVISPWIFYLISVVGSVKAMTFVVGFLGALTSLFFTFVFFDNDCPEEFTLKKFITMWTITLMICLTSLLTPSEKTMKLMVAASFMTKDNINLAVEQGGKFKNELKQDILDILEIVSGEKEEEKK